MWREGKQWVGWKVDGNLRSACTGFSFNGSAPQQPSSPFRHGFPTLSTRYRSLTRSRMTSLLFAVLANRQCGGLSALVVSASANRQRPKSATSLKASVILDLVSEERAESVGNPCRNGGEPQQCRRIIPGTGPCLTMLRSIPGAMPCPHSSSPLSSSMICVNSTLRTSLITLSSALKFGMRTTSTVLVPGRNW